MRRMGNTHPPHGGADHPAHIVIFVLQWGAVKQYTVCAVFLYGAELTFHFLL